MSNLKFKRILFTLLVLTFCTSGAEIKANKKNLRPKTKIEMRQTVSKHRIKADAKQKTSKLKEKVKQKASKSKVKRVETKQKGAIASLKNTTYNLVNCPHGSVTYDVYANQNLTEGKVTISNTNSSILVNVDMGRTAYKIQKLQIFAAPYNSSCDSIPLTKSGNPNIKAFPFAAAYTPALSKMAYEIPVSALNCFGTCNDHKPLRIVVHLKLISGDSLISGYASGGVGACWPGSHWGYCLMYDFCCKGSDTNSMNGNGFHCPTGCSYMRLCPGQENIGPCTGGCTLTYNYWKGHTASWPSNGPRPTDVFCNGMTYIGILTTPSTGDSWYALAHQYVAALLNKTGGSCRQQ